VHAYREVCGFDRLGGIIIVDAVAKVCEYTAIDEDTLSRSSEPRMTSGLEYQCLIIRRHQ
jgi:hypothetical protein